MRLEQGTCGDRWDLVRNPDLFFDGGIKAREEGEEVNMR